MRPLFSSALRSALCTGLLPLAPVSLSVSLSLSLFAACSPSTIVVGELEEVTALKAIPNRNLDILFVVDNSPSMLSKQQALAANFPRMIEVLENLEGGLPDLHIGVVTSDMGTLGSASMMPGPPVGTAGGGGCAGVGDDGALQAGSPALTGSFISDVAGPSGERIRNYTGELRSVFSELALVEDRGCGFEQHLAATRRALTNPANGGFVRADANLAVIIIADEDDCSVLEPSFFGPESPVLGPLSSFRCARHGIVCDPDNFEPGPKQDCAPRAASAYIEDVQPFVDAILQVKPDPRMVMVGAIVGDPEPVSVISDPIIPGMPALRLAPACTFPGGADLQIADPAVRIAAFLDAFPGLTQLTSICSGDLSAPLVAIGATAKKLVGDPCLDSEQLYDVSEPDPGVQPACEVTDVRDAAPDLQRYLPSCAEAGGDCFEIASDPATCPSTPDHLRIRVRRETKVTDDTWTHVRCQVRR